MSGLVLQVLCLSLVLFLCPLFQAAASGEDQPSPSVASDFTSKTSVPESNENNKQTNGISGIWYGRIKADSLELLSTLQLQQKDDSLTGTLTSSGNGGLSKHFFSGKFDSSQNRFVCSDTNVERSGGYGNWTPIPVEEYLIQITDNGARLEGTCRQAKSDKTLSFSYTRNRNDVGIDRDAAPFRSDPDKKFNLEEAREYLLKLINQERAQFSLPPVALDKVATAAAQFHSDDTAARGFNDHYDLEGRGPDWRYTLAGGTNMIAENQVGTYCDDSWNYSLSKNQKFSKAELEKTASIFFDETPPNDGHRKNILDPKHNRVGIGLSVSYIDRPLSNPYEFVTCCQEFMDDYGTFSHLPFTIQPGASMKLTGKLSDNMQLYTIDIRREDLPGPTPIKELRKNFYHGYSSPDKILQVFGSFQTTKTPDGGFSLDIPVQPGWGKGLYHVFVWASDKQGHKVVTSHQVVAVGLDRPLPKL